nr:uncharacterized protein LOC104096888 [Nicotiana tomentosiformis]
MGISITTYKIIGSSDKEAASMIVAGFTGMLRHWWDNYFTEDLKQAIYTTIAIETVVKTKGTTETSSQITKEDACAILLYHIATHITGDPKLFQDRSLQILNNLSYPTLDDFTWYKNQFISKVMIRPDCHLKFWKERFVSGLPTLFAYKRSSSRRELGSFCQDFGFTSIFVPSTHSSKRDKKFKSYKKTHRSKSRRGSERTPDSERTPKRKSKFRTPSKYSYTNVCWNCEETGHRANECKSGQKKKKINLLEISEEAKKELYSILEEVDLDSSGDSGSDIDVTYETNSSQSSGECNCNEAF